VTGIYAGVLVPITILVGDPPAPMIDNSLALFTLTIPRVDLATGKAAVFRNGIFYSGTIQGSADPDSARLTGVVNAFFQETIATSGNTTFIFEFDANGRFVNTKITANSNTSSSASTRIRGKATITYRNDAGDPMGDSGGPIEYRVHGFKQSS